MYSSFEMSLSEKAYFKVLVFMEKKAEFIPPSVPISALLYLVKSKRDPYTGLGVGLFFLLCSAEVWV